MNKSDYKYKKTAQRRLRLQNLSNKNPAYSRVGVVLITLLNVFI